MTVINPQNYCIEKKVIQYLPGTVGGIPKLLTSGDELVDTSIVSLIKSSSGLRIKYGTDAIVNSAGYIEGLIIHRRQLNPMLYARFLVNDLASSRFFIGFTNKNAIDHAVANEPAGGNYFGLLFDSASADWRIISRGGSTGTNRPSGITATTGVHEVYLEMFSVNGSNRLQYQIDDNDISDDANNMPIDGTDLRLVAVVLTKNGVVKSFELGKCLISSDF